MPTHGLSPPTKVTSPTGLSRLGQRSYQNFGLGAHVICLRYRMVLSNPPIDSRPGTIRKPINSSHSGKSVPQRRRHRRRQAPPPAQQAFPVTVPARAFQPVVGASAASSSGGWRPQLRPVEHPVQPRSQTPQGNPRSRSKPGLRVGSASSSN